jgi:hypothetical protein
VKLDHARQRAVGSGLFSLTLSISLGIGLFETEEDP